MITYKNISSNPIQINVLLDGKTVGVIKQKNLMFFYKPKGSKITGIPFNTIREVKSSLESGE